MCVITFFTSCESRKGKHAIVTNNRDNIVKVKDKIIAFDTKGEFFGSNVEASIYNNLLFFTDDDSKDELIRIYNLDSLSFVVGTGVQGRGPGEIGRMYGLVIDEFSNKFYVPDYATYKMFSYDIDSLLKLGKQYEPSVKWKMSPSEFPNEFMMISKDKAIGQMIKPIGTSKFNMAVSTIDMNTGATSDFVDLQPDIEKKRFTICVSPSDNIFVQAFQLQDLLTIADLKGNRICDVVGKGNEDNKIYYTTVCVVGNRIFAAFSGKESHEEDSFRPTLVDVFDFQGKYIETLDVGYRIVDICYDKRNKRAFFVFDDVIQFGFLNV